MDRKAFFDAVRERPFGGRLSQEQVRGLEDLLAAAPADMALEPLAYCLATTYHETARTMQPIKEHGGERYFHRMYDIQGNRPHVARALGNTQPGDGARFAGRGYVQITGRTNYERAGRLLGIDLVGSPALALKPQYAAPILYTGMVEGWFTGRRLSHYFGDGKHDPVNARRIVNGTDRAGQIAGYHDMFEAALREAGCAPGSAAPIPPPPDVEPVPDKRDAASFWAALYEWLREWFGRKP